MMEENTQAMPTTGTDMPASDAPATPAPETPAETPETEAPSQGDEGAQA